MRDWPARVGGTVLIFIGAVLLSFLLTRPPSPLVASDRLFEAVAFRFFAPDRPTSDRIVIVAITEETLLDLPYRSPIDRKFLADLVETLRARAVRAIGLDIVLDRATEPTKDALLEEAIARAPVVLASVGADTDLSGSQRQYLDSFLAGHPHGQVNLPRDIFDDVVHNYLPIDPNGQPSFASVIAQKAGIMPPTAIFPIVWRRSKTGQPFAVYPAHLIGVLPPDWLRDKIVLVGTLVPGQDEHRTPLSIFARPMYGVEIHAHVLSQMLEGRAFQPGRWGEASIAVAAGLGMGLAAATSGALLIAGLIVLIVGAWAGAILAFSFIGPFFLPLAPTLGLGLGAGGVRLWIAWIERRDRRILRQLFSRFVSEPVARELWNERKTFLQGGRPRPVSLTATVLFSDIAGFTSYTEKLPPEPLYRWLDDYIDAMVEVVNAWDGIVLRFIGDGILAVFGVPIGRQSEAAIDRDAQNAVCAAKAMVGAVRRLNAGWRENELPQAIIRIGIYTGPLMAGSVGNGSHMEYILQGDTVNTAARLEALGKNYLGQDDECVIIVGETTWERLRDLESIGRKIDEVKLKGKEKRTTIYRILPD